MGHLSLPPVIDLGWGVGAFFASLLLWKLGRDIRNIVKAKFWPDPDPPQTYREALDAEERKRG